MSSHVHVEMCVLCILQCARYENLREEIIALNIVNYLTNFVKRHNKIASIVRTTLKIFIWVGTTSELMDIIVDADAVGTAIKCIERHFSNSQVVSPGILFMTRAAKLCPYALECILGKFYW
jgi:hypothetical protein